MIEETEGQMGPQGDIEDPRGREGWESSGRSLKKISQSR